MGYSKSSRDYKKHSGKAVNPSLQTATRLFIDNHLPPGFLTEHGIDSDLLLSSISKRFTAYGTLLLLPPNFFNRNTEWESVIALLSHDQLRCLYSSIASTFAPIGVTHIAVNAPISLTTDAGKENKIRGPTNLVPLYGDFGPMPPPGDQSIHPSEPDFQNAFWVKTIQNSRIVQIWAPLYTMFSRGNVSEKARILGLQSEFDGLNEQQLQQRLQDIAVIDMYAGIGYFVFSYLKMGVGRVWAWELNGWSIEGLRRGCDANKWGIKIMKVSNEGKIDGIDGLIDQLGDDNLRVVAFHGDNSFAIDVMKELKEKLELRKLWKRIRHANLGLLPSSKDSWKTAVTLIDCTMGGWAHVHENVDIHEIPKQAASITGEFKELLQLRSQENSFLSIPPHVGISHVEKVKTYAPGVMHCVFDVHIQPEDTAEIQRNTDITL